MFNAEQMLGKMLTGALHSGSRSSGFGSSLASQLSSGAGLMTLIGLGVGAYEILKGQNSPPVGGQEIPPPISPAATPSSPPPPPTQPNQIPSVPPPIQPPNGNSSVSPHEQQQRASASQLDGPNLALRMIQSMIAAAAADGRIDSEEEAKILQKFQERALSSEEKQVLLQELQNPKSINELTAGIGEPATAQALYSIAVLAITIDTEVERKWLDRFALALHISPEMQRFLEDAK